MSSAYGSTVNVPTPVQDLNTVLPLYNRLKDDSDSALASQVRIVRVDRSDESQLTQLHAMLNHEIKAGDTYPQEHEMNVEEWGRYFLSAEAFVVLKGGAGEEAGKEVLGTFYIKPNFPGRCSHDHRKKGVGGVMAKAFLTLAPALGYRASMFNLVFVSNVASIKLWKSLGFQEIGRIPKAGRLRTISGTEDYVDAIIFYKSFVDDKQ